MRKLLVHTGIGIDRVTLSNKLTAENSMTSDSESDATGSPIKFSKTSPVQNDETRSVEIEIVRLVPPHSTTRLMTPAKDDSEVGSTSFTSSSTPLHDRFSCGTATLTTSPTFVALLPPKERQSSADNPSSELSEAQSESWPRDRQSSASISGAGANDQEAPTLLPSVFSPGSSQEKIKARLRTMSTPTTTIIAESTSPNPATSFQGAPTGSSSGSTPSTNVVAPLPTTSNPALEDGPLFRALVHSYERRARSLRSALKELCKAANDAIEANQDNSAAQDRIDRQLSQLSVSSSSSTTRSDLLAGLYEGALKKKRDEARQTREQERVALEEWVQRMKEAMERLKMVEMRRKQFEGDTKDYYHDLGKYLSKTDDSAKSALLDIKQKQRTTSYEAHRLDYFSMVESLVESEEALICTWLRMWVGIDGEPLTVSKEATEMARKKSRDHARATISRALAEGLKEEDFEASGTEDDETASNGSVLSRVSGQSGLRRKKSTSGHGLGIGSSGNGGPSAPSGPKKRASIPNFNEASLEAAETAKDRIRSFVKSTQRVFSHAPASTSSAAPTPITTSGSLAPSISPAAVTLSDDSDAKSESVGPNISTAPKPNQPPTSTGATQAHLPPPSNRRKEGLLYATPKASTHTTAGDGGGHYSPHWCVLSEGQLVEFADWQQPRDIKNTPINLAAASVRVSHNTDRRFCFEVLTPNFRRIYQATNETEMNDWVVALTKSIESLLNGTSSVRHFDATRLSGSASFAPYLLSDLGSTLSLSSGGPKSPPFDSNPGAALPTSPTQSNFGLGHQLSNRLTSWVSEPLSRRTSLGSKKLKAKREQELKASREKATAAAKLQEQQTFVIASSPQPSPSLALNPTEATSYGLGSDHASVERASGASQSSALADNISETDRIILGRVSQLIDGAEMTSPPLSSDAATTNTAFSSVEPSGVVDAKESKRRNAGLIQLMANEPGNNICADCQAPDPKWASWSLGVFICIRCSGVHRSLGTHVSKVRSVELDDWNDEQIGAMRARGNVKANSVLEARKPIEIVPDDSTITTYIKMKYVERAWATTV